jgi:ElaB/YqjD/DUF883 family membrane-anchored ribosome-binding protein
MLHLHHDFRVTPLYIVHPWTLERGPRCGESLDLSEKLFRLIATKRGSKLGLDEPKSCVYAGWRFLALGMFSREVVGQERQRLFERWELGWSGGERKPILEIEVKDIQKQLDSLRDYLGDLTASVSKIANRRWRDARGRAIDTAQEAEAVMKENLAASLVVALGVGILVGYLIRRGAE